MTGSIRTKEHCPQCARPFPIESGKGFYCKKCDRWPKKLHLRLYIKGHGKVYIHSDENGKPLDSYRRAYDLLARINHEIKNHTFDATRYIRQEAEKFWISNLLDKFKKSRVKTLAPSYQLQYALTLDRCEKHFGTKDVRDLHKIDLIGLKESFEALSLSAKTVKNCVDIFKTFLRWCVSDMEILSAVPSFPEIDVPDPPVRWLSQEDQIRIFNIVPAKDRPIIAFLMLHGCRPAEARALKIKDVNWPNRMITISSTFSKNIYMERRKGRKAKPVTIPIHAELEEYIGQRIEEALPGAWLFINPRNNHGYHESALRRLWDRIRKEAKVGKDLKLYAATRHSVATQLRIAGTSLLDIKDQLGHSDIRTTEKYAHMDVEHMRINLQKLSLKKIIPWGSTGVLRESAEEKNHVKSTV